MNSEYNNKFNDFYDVRRRKKLNVLLVEPQKSHKYHTCFPPLGLLKLATYHNERKDIVKLVTGVLSDGFDPDVIYITSLFTYAWEPVHEIIKYYTNTYKKVPVRVGGIYATLCHNHLRDRFGDRIEVWQGLVPEIEDVLPAYWLVPSWKASVLFSSRGCIRKCPFCSVSQLEPYFKTKISIKHLIYHGHKKVIFWDNNILASPYWRHIFSELEELKLEVDFNQGLDARLLTEEVATNLRRLRLPILRLAYDSQPMRDDLKRAIDLLRALGFNKKRIIVYCLYNYNDSPDDFLTRIKDLIDWGVVSYPMRYQSLKPESKNSYISANWTREQLEMLARARRVIGYGGAFPSYEGLKKKFLQARYFEDAFSLRPPSSKEDQPISE